VKPTDDKPIEADHGIQRRYPREIRYCPLCGAPMNERLVIPDHKRVKTCSGCGFVYFQGPKLVAGCLVQSENRVLLLRRGIEPSMGLWTFPGGYVDLGETPAEAAIRETAEEVGMNVRLGALMGIYADPEHPVAAVAVYLAEPGAESPRQSLEATEVRYFAADEIPWPDLAFRTTRDALRDWTSRPRTGPS
jgi:ADP-ribose pyrophosphatase YjhB (NUDIX family)